MERLINGKNKEVIMKELEVPFSDLDKETNNDGYVYVNVQKYLDRLDVVVGALNYNVYTVSTDFVNGYIFKTVCIEILYDDGTIAVKKCGDGGAALIYPRDEQGQPSLKPKGAENTNDAAFSDAVKRACKGLRMGLELYHENRKRSGREKEPVRTVTGEKEMFKLVFHEELTQKNFSGDSLCAEVEDTEGFVSTLIIKDEVKQFLQRNNTLQQLIEISKNRGKAKIYGVYQVYGYKKFPQIIMCGGE